MVRSPDSAAYVVDRATASIFRVDLSTGDGSVVVTKGDGAGRASASRGSSPSADPMCSSSTAMRPVALATVGRRAVALARLRRRRHGARR
jgi:hypothetical protein